MLAGNPHRVIETQHVIGVDLPSREEDPFNNSKAHDTFGRVADPVMRHFFATIEHIHRGLMLAPRHHTHLKWLAVG